MVYEQIKN